MEKLAVVKKSYAYYSVDLDHDFYYNVREVFQLYTSIPLTKFLTFVNNKIGQNIIDLLQTNVYEDYGYSQKHENVTRYPPLEPTLEEIDIVKSIIIVNMINKSNDSDIFHFTKLEPTYQTKHYLDVFNHYEMEKTVCPYIVDKLKLPKGGYDRIDFTNNSASLNVYLILESSYNNSLSGAYDILSSENLLDILSFKQLFILYEFIKSKSSNLHFLLHDLNENILPGNKNRIHFYEGTTSVCTHIFYSSYFDDEYEMKTIQNVTKVLENCNVKR